MKAARFECAAQPKTEGEEMSTAVGVIGTGVMGSEHVRIIQKESSGGHLVAVCDADETRARAAAPQSIFHAHPLALIRSNAVEAVPIPMKPPHCSEMIAPPDSGMISPPVSGVCRQ